MHIEKYQKHAVGHMLRHYNRTSTSYSNPDIDYSRTQFNYNLAPERKLTDMEYYHKRLGEVKCQNRSDVNTLCDWIVTLPKLPFTQKEERHFFEAVYEFLSERYSEKNVVSAWVHKDEGGQAHMHFCFIPVTLDQKKKIEKVCAKEVINRNELSKIHREMAACMEKEFGYDVGIINGSTIGGNKSILELKLQDIREDICTLERLRTQNINEMAVLIKKKPSVLAQITKAVKIALGKAEPEHEKNINRFPERSR